MGMTNAAHFSKRLRPIRYKVNYKSRNNDVERVIRERQLLRVRNPKIHSLRDWFVARDFDLWLRRVNRDHCGGRARTDYKVGKDSSATTDIEPARMSGRCEPIQKYRTHGTGLAAHELLIGGAIAKMLRVLGHFAPLLLRLNRPPSKHCVSTALQLQTFAAKCACRLTRRLSSRSLRALRVGPKVRLKPGVIRHRVLAHRAVMRNRGDGATLGSDASPPSHDPLTRQKMLPCEMRYEVPSGPSASRSAFHPALAAAEPGLGYGLSAGGNFPGTLLRSPTTITTHPLYIFPSSSKVSGACR